MFEVKPLARTLCLDEMIADDHMYSTGRATA